MDEHQSSTSSQLGLKTSPKKIGCSAPSLGPPPPEDGGHAPHDALDAGVLLAGAAALPHRLQELVEDHQGAVVGLGGRDLKEVTVGRNGEQAPLLAGDLPPVLEVALVAHDDDGRGAVAPLQLADALELLAHHLEAVAVADAVDQDEAVRPAQLLLAGAGLGVRVLQRKDLLDIGYRESWVTANMAALHLSLRHRPGHGAGRTRTGLCL